jgi:hypothetical protein
MVARLAAVSVTPGTSGTRITKGTRWHLAIMIVEDGLVVAAGSAGDGIYHFIS